MRQRIGSLLVVSFLMAGCADATSSPTPSQDSGPRVVAIPLPKGAFPRFLTVAADGTVWCSESSGESVAHIDRDGKVSHVRIPGNSNSPANVVQSPDGVIWFSGFQLIGKIDAAGKLSGWRTELRGRPQIGLPEAMTLGPDKAIWYTNESGPAITRISPAGEFTDFPIPSDKAGLDLTGITAGPDNALWLTVVPIGGGKGHAIGRLTLDGHFTSWPLTGHEPRPQRIVAGPDGALWFTLQAGSIGRITVDGAVSTFPLPAGAHPFDIVSGRDGALWFTTDQHSVGRISTSGQIELHPVEGSQRLIGIAAAPDGTLWVADGPAATIWQLLN